MVGLAVCLGQCAAGRPVGPCDLYTTGRLLGLVSGGRACVYAPAESSNSQLSIASHQRGRATATVGMPASRRPHDTTLYDITTD